MERRQFIKNTGTILATSALAGLPQILNANTLQEEVEKKVTFESGLASPSIGKYGYYNLTLYPSAINNFKSSSDSKRDLVLKASNETSSSIYNYTIKKVKKIKGLNTTFKVQAKYKSKSANSSEVPKEISKKIYFNIQMNEPITNSSIELQNNKKEKITTLKPKLPKTNSGSGATGCYITTACITAKNLPDNCYELETLREFRDNYIVKTPKGKEWVQMYYLNAPNIVERIDNRSNKQEIYDYIYKNLVTKSVELIENKNYDTAFHFYKDCVTKLDQIIK